jgi:ureidoglycolate lyase
MTNQSPLRIIRARPIEAADFAPYGQLLELPENGTRQDHAARLDAAASGLRPNLAVVRAEPKPMPLTVEAMERHPSSSQAFMPLSAARYLVLVCPSGADGAPDLDRLDAFVCTGRQAINYDRGTWHHGMTTLDEPGTFAMFMWDEGSERDTEWWRLPDSVRIAISV